VRPSLADATTAISNPSPPSGVARTLLERAGDDGAATGAAAA